jgi:hypothetical protein
MSLQDFQVANVKTRRKSRTILLTSYGTKGGSYDITAQRFVPLLSRWGEVIQVARVTEPLEAAAQDARRRGLQPIHVCFGACQDMVFTSSAPNAIVTVWEYPDVPGEAFDGNPQNNWTATANRCDLILVVGDFTAEALRRAGVRTPIRIVPTPTPDDYFAVPPWRVDRRVRIACSAYVFPNADAPADERWDAPDPVGPVAAARLGRLAQSLRRVWQEQGERFSPPLLAGGIRWLASRLRTDRWRTYLRSCRREAVDLSGVVYTSIFSTGDTRENWQDLLTGFVSAFHDREDATLVVELAACERARVEQILDFYRGVGLSHRCKIVFITDFSATDQTFALARASTYYLTATRAEGNCLPLLNYLAAGRPGVAACHSAIGDYFGDYVGLTIPWQPEPAPWPQDSRARLKTTWARLDWAALVERLRESYALALYDRSAYAVRATRARQRLRERTNAASVWPQLAAALNDLDAIGDRNASAA